MGCRRPGAETGLSSHRPRTRNCGAPAHPSHSIPTGFFGMADKTRRQVMVGMGAASVIPHSARSAADEVSVNGRNYRKPRRPTVVICVDGFDPTYLQQGLRDGILPNLAKFAAHGFSATARGVMPS